MNNSKALPFQVNQKIVDLCIAKSELNDRHEKEEKEGHVRLWAAVYEEYPELDGDASFTLKTEFAEQGVVMLTEHIHDENCIVGKFKDKFKGKLPVKLAGMLERAMKDVN